MPGKLLFEYAVIRIVPKVEREEFLNVGVVLYCHGKDILQVKYEVNTDRLKSFSNQIDIPEIDAYLHAFERICNAGEDGGPISKLPAAERFRWLTATRSTVVQTSKVHPGMGDDIDHVVERLYEQMVLQ